MKPAKFALLRGVCQTPAYVAKEKGFLADEGIDARLEVAPTAWVVPQRLARGDVDFAVIPWTRVAAAKAHGEDLVAICGSGIEEAALVLAPGVTLASVDSVAVPQEGGMKDLTAAGLIKSLGLHPTRTLRLPSGDAAILSFVGRAVDAAVMVEPYATMLEVLGMGKVVRRTGDVWPGAPGCSLATSRRTLLERPSLVQSVVRAYVRGADHVASDPADAARISAEYIGIHADIVRRALDANRPSVRALHNRKAMDGVLDLMTELGYLSERPTNFTDLSFVDQVLAAAVPLP